MRSENMAKNCPKCCQIARNRNGARNRTLHSSITTTCGKNKRKPKTNSQNNVKTLCVLLCATVVHDTAQNSADNLPSYPPDSHHCSDAVYWRGEGTRDN